MRNFLGGIGLITLILAGCKENIDVFIPDSSNVVDPNAGDIAHLFRELAPSLQTHSGQAEEAWTFRSEGGVVVTFPANAFVDGNGLSVSGAVEADILEVFSMGDMIRNRLQAVSKGRLFESAGMIFVNVRQNGKTLHLAPKSKMEVQLPAQDINPSVELFYEAEIETRPFSWLEADEETPGAPANVFATERYDPELQIWTPAYEFYSDRLGWMAVGVLSPTGGEMTSLCAGLPSGYGKNNTAVFLALPGTNSVLEFSWNSEDGARQCCLNDVPAGQDGVLVALSERGAGLFHFRYAEINTGFGSTAVTMKPAETSRNDILEFLNGL
jgi:hypothetical protein